MKKTNSLLILMVMLLTGCEGFRFDASYTSNSKSDSINSSTSVKDSTNNPSSNCASSNTTTSSIVSIDKDSSSTNASSSVIEEETARMFINYVNYDVDWKYDTGDYGSVGVEGTVFEHYRARESYYYGDLMTLLPYNSSINDGSIPGMVYNIKAILGIREISITYRTENSIGNKPILRYGEDNQVTNEVELPLSNEEITQNFKIKNASYFKIETNGYKLDIVSISIRYTGVDNNSSYELLSSGDNQYRINPVRYTGELIGGVSKVSVPTSVRVNGSNYEVNQTKEYTYYSYYDISNDLDLVSKASYTSPEDVAAYFIAFGTYPANYVSKNQYASAYKVFGEYTRCVSNYDRTDGYATKVPWRAMPGDNVPLYYECDIALTPDYSKSNRGVGRVVVWYYGFDVDGYDDAPVAVYTDDHYATFQEYLNTGSYGIRFNSEKSPTSYIWGSPMILTIK